MIDGSTKKNWLYILDKMGYLGILRNLRNLIIHDVDSAHVVGRIADRKNAAPCKVSRFPVPISTRHTGLW